MSLLSDHNSESEVDPNLQGASEFYQANARLCSALLWSAKIASKGQQKGYQASKNRRINWKNPALYKTRLCDYWSTGNPCKFGLNCWYAHGPVELRHVPRLDKDPVATSISLAEVVQKLPPSRDKMIALEQAESQLIANIKSDAFNQHALKELAGQSTPTSAPPQLASPPFFASPPRSPSDPDAQRLPFFKSMACRKPEEEKAVNLSTGQELPCDALEAYQPYLNPVIAPPANSAFHTGLRDDVFKIFEPKSGWCL